MINSFTINGLTMGRSTTIAINKADGFSAPSVQNSMFYLAGQHGARNPNSYWRERRISLELSIRGTSIANYVSQRNSVLLAFGLPTSGPALATITTTDGRTLQMMVYLDSITGPFEQGQVSFGNMRIDLFAVDPYIYSQDETEVEISLPVVAGTDIPTEVPLSLGYGSGVGETITLLGNGLSSPIITITGPVVNPIIKNDTYDEELEIEGDFTGSDEIVIDMENETITQNGSINLLDDSNEVFWKLRPGANLIIFSSSTYDAAALAVVRYRESWLGI